MKMVALIPARAGSKRIPGKNTKLLAGQPLIYWTIDAAMKSGVFESVVVCSDDETAIDLAVDIGADFVRRERSEDTEPDIEWVRVSMKRRRADAFCILRPTSPFRTAETIQRAYALFQTQEVHSIRAVQPVKEHPGKMWQQVGVGYPMTPLIGKGWPTPPNGEPFYHGDTPWHSQPTQTLPQVYVQNASLEMAWSLVIQAFGTISGNKIAPFFTHGYEGFDLNTMDDWREAERLIAQGLVELPALSLARIS